MFYINKNRRFQVKILQSVEKRQQFCIMLDWSDCNLPGSIHGMSLMWLKNSWVCQNLPFDSAGSAGTEYTATTYIEQKGMNYKHQMRKKYFIKYKSQISFPV